MQKTLTIEIADQRKELAEAMTYYIYKELTPDEHVSGCEYIDTPENRCTCALSELIELVRGGK
jgi:hypothetical protein